MRTTLDIDNDVLEAAKELAGKQKSSAGQVVSQLLRKALTGQTENTSTSKSTKPKIPPVAVFRPFPAGKAVVCNETINHLRDAEDV